MATNNNIRFLNQQASFWDFISELGPAANRDLVSGAYARPFGAGDGSDRPGRPGWSSAPWAEFFDGGEGRGEREQPSDTAPPSPPSPPPPEYDVPPPLDEPQHSDGPPPSPGSHHRGGLPRQGGPSHDYHGQYWHHGPGGRGRGGGGRGRRGSGFGYGFGFGDFGRGRCGGGRRNGPGGGWANFGFNGSQGGALGDFLAQQFGAGFDRAGKGKAGEKEQDFSPPCDVFDTPEAFVLHFSLPGAKKEDVGVNWDADKSELNVAGVIYRPADEEVLKTLAMDEREVGAFERKIRLGSRASPASVESDAITARMEDGVLVVRVPKVEEFVEIKKVDIE